MLIQKEFLNKLKDFGLNTYEARLWTALLSRGVSTAGELSDIANVPRSRTYDVLESLEKKGFIIMKLGKPIKCLAVHPNEVIERIKKKVIQEAQETTDLISNLKSSKLFEDLNSLHAKGVDLIEPTEISGAFKGRDSIYLHLGGLFKNARRSIVICSTSQGVIRKLSSFRNIFEKKSQKGVRIRISAPITKSVLDGLNLPKNVELKSTKIQGRFCVIDEKEIVFMILDDKEVNPDYDVGIWLNSPYLSSTILSFFENVWDAAPKL